MNIAVMPLAEWAPLLLTPDMKPPRLETCLARYMTSELERMTSRKSASGTVASATTRLPRVCSMFTCELFLSVAKLDSRKKRSIPGARLAQQLHPAVVGGHERPLRCGQRHV